MCIREYYTQQLFSWSIISVRLNERKILPSFIYKKCDQNFVAQYFYYANYDEENRVGCSSRAFISLLFQYVLKSSFNSIWQKRLRMNAIKINCLMIQSLKTLSRSLLGFLQFKSSCYAFLKDFMRHLNLLLHIKLSEFQK